MIPGTEAARSGCTDGTARSGAKIPVERKWYAARFTALRGGNDATDEFTDLFALFVFDNYVGYGAKRCDLYVVTPDGEIRYFSRDLPAETGLTFYGYFSGYETVTQGPVEVTLYASETDPGTVVTLEQVPENGEYFGEGVVTHCAVFADAYGTVYLQPEETGTDLVNIRTGERITMQEYSDARADAILGGSITAETSGDATGLNVKSESRPVSVEIRPGMKIFGTAPAEAVPAPEAAVPRNVRPSLHRRRCLHGRRRPVRL